MVEYLTSFLTWKIFPQSEPILWSAREKNPWFEKLKGKCELIIMAFVYHINMLFILLLLKVFTMFQVISLEGWTDVMYFVQDAHSFWNWIYFVMLIVVNTKLTQAHRGKHRTNTSSSW
jgi:hypothetical protein